MDTPTLADRIIAPLTWLERSRGWKRRGLASLYLVITLTVGVLVWRGVSLWRLPNAPEPFDLAKDGKVQILDADNAMVADRAVIAKFGDLSTRGYEVGNLKDWDVTDWTAANPEVRRWAEDHRAAREAWLPANDRPDSLLVRPEQMRMNTDLEPARRIRPYAHLARLEGSRLEASGDLAGAWRMYRASLRASRHVGRHGGTIQRLIGFGILKQTCRWIDSWVDRPGITPELLRRAIADVEACRAMTAPASDMARAEYFSARDAVLDTDRWRRIGETGPYSDLHWYNQSEAGRWGYRFLQREPERSARVLRLLFAGFLAQCDRPSSARPRLVDPFLMIYDHDSQTPRPVRSITPDALESWARDSIVLELGPFSPQILGQLDAECTMLDGLLLKMAERAFVIERGHPPKSYSELIGSYLKALPTGIEPGDPVPLK